LNRLYRDLNPHESRLFLREHRLKKLLFEFAPNFFREKKRKESNEFFHELRPEQHFKRHHPASKSFKFFFRH
jgi:hypothetical protein